MRRLYNTTHSHFFVLTIEHIICSDLLWKTVQMHSTEQHMIHKRAEEKHIIEVVKTFCFVLKNLHISEDKG
jgi:hypothetical protein